MRNEDRERAIKEIVGRIVTERMEQAQQPGGQPIDRVLNDTIYHEKRRLKNEKPSQRRDDDHIFWQRIQKSLPHANERMLKEMLTQSVTRFAGEVSGNFNPRVYQFSTRILPYGLGFLLNATSPSRILRDFPRGFSVENSIHLSGNVELFQKLDKLGTVILAPTHLSNLDSPLMGWSIFQLGLPPFTYGAGLNLFSNPLLSFFMRNLGAYRVDRLKKAKLYKDILKEYATCSLEYGYNQLFFPGGTRSRGGDVERKVKKGLLGTALSAYTRNLINKRSKPNLYIVPCTINYHLVLEGKSLIDDYLKRSGKHRYIVENDESSDLNRIVQFVTNLVTLNAQIHIVFGQAMDPFGNLVDEQGQSFDQRGRPIDITRYVSRAGVPVIDTQRDQEYTNEIAEQIMVQFSKNNMIMSTHLLAASCFRLLQRKNANLDLYRLLHTGGYIDQLEYREVCEEVESLLTQLKKLRSQGEIQLEPSLCKDDVSHSIDEALRFFRSYHHKPVLQRHGTRITPGDLNLLYYYNNRLMGYPLEHSAA